MAWCLDCHRDPAAALRPGDKVFEMSWRFPADQARQGARLAAEYHVRTDHLTDCSVCHR